MDRDDSIVHVAFSFVASRPYIGAVEARCPILRWNEHWADMQKSGRGEATELKYEYMHDYGAVSGWYFLPWVSCGGQIPWAQLHTLELTKIKEHPNSLNNMRSRYAPLKAFPGLSDGKQVPSFPSRKSEKVSDKVVKPMVQYIQNGSIIQNIGNLTEALALSDYVAWHSYYPWSVLAAERRWTRSTVLIVGSSGEIFKGPFRQGSRTIRKWKAGYRLLIFIDR